MIVTEIQFNLKLPDDKERTPGLHVSNIVRRIALMVGILKEENDDLGPSVVRMSVGMAWESWISAHHPEVMKHPGEYLLDGVLLSPDGISFPDGKVMIHEFKATWKSMRRNVEEEWMWLCQIKSYCKAAGTNLAQLHVLWVNGDYRGSGPQYRVYHLEFSVREIDENWELIKKSAEYVEPKTKTKVLTKSPKAGFSRKALRPG